MWDKLSTNVSNEPGDNIAGRMRKYRIRGYHEVQSLLKHVWYDYEPSLEQQTRLPDLTQSFLVVDRRAFYRTRIDSER